MRFLSTVITTLCLALNAHSASAAEPIIAVELYTQDQLLSMIAKNEHLTKVVLDRCQLVQDIEARAQTLKYPPFNFCGVICWPGEFALMPSPSAALVL